MAKKKDEKDVLVVRDEKTGEISVVAGLNADGTPKRTPAKAENAQSFLQFDRHGDVLDNFFKNFFRQCKEPSRFGFYRIAADQAENLLEVMKQLLKDPEANKELLAPHKVDTSDYEKKVQEEMAAQQTEKQEPQKQENMEQRKEQQQDKSEQMQGKRGYQPIDESKINWQELEDRWGVKRDNLEKSGDLTKMLNYGKSDLVKVKPTFGGESFELDARLSFKKDGEGNISLVPHFIRKEQKLDEYKEHKFSDNDRKNLRETGNLGRVVDIVDRETGEIIPSYISIDPNEPMRLNKYLANAGVCSRREADEFIQAGVVTVNGAVVTELGTKVLRSDEVKFHDQPVSLEKKVYVLLNKPKDYVTTSDDPQQRKTVMDLVKNACPERIYPVGRLDRNTTGVLLLTNDGDMASKLTHPKFLKKKIYHVHLDKNVTAHDLQQIRDGITLEDGEIKADDVQYADPVDKKQVGIEIHSGKNRIVRRIFEKLGYRVTKLDRVQFAGLTKKGLRRGDWRYLTEEEVVRLRMGSYE